ncbi:MAG: mechanosensitive ion channel family protein [Bacteroidales bacterium]
MTTSTTEYTLLQIFLIAGSFLFLLLVGYTLFRLGFRFLQRKVEASPGQLDTQTLELFKTPALFLLLWVVLKIYTYLFLNHLQITTFLQYSNTFLLIVTLSWIAISLVNAGEHYIQKRLDLQSPDNLHARKSLTQLKVFKAIANSIIVIVAFSAILMSFEAARNIGVSLLTSAGVLGVVVGLAAQKSIGMILAGIQLAITQPIRLDDVVIVEGEWGKIEEITLTYVVVRIWDERRLVLPVNWFLETPFQNWTRNSAEILGTVFLYVDYNFPVDELRMVLTAVVGRNPNWDGRVQNIQVTAVQERCKELRVLVSSKDASKNWELRVAVREALIDHIAQHHPNAFAKVRWEQTGEA